MPQNPARFKQNIALLLVMACLMAGCKDGMRFSTQEEAKKQLQEVKGPEVKGIEATLREQAEAAIKAGNLPQAEATYKQLTDGKPDNMEYRYGYADVLRREDKCPDALPVFELILAKEPQNAAAIEGKGLCVMGKGEIKAASKLFSQVMAIDSKRWRTLNAIGILFAMKGMPDEAMSYYKEALKNNPNAASVNNNIGLTYALNKKYDDAISTFRQTIAGLPDESPDVKRLSLNLALAYGLAGNMDEAEKAASPYLSKPALYNNLGFYAYLSKNDALAKSYLNMSLSTSPSYYERAWDNLQGMNGGHGPDTSDIDLPLPPKEAKEPKALKEPSQPKEEPASPKQ